MQIWLSNLFEKGKCLAEIVLNYEEFTTNLVPENYLGSSYRKIAQSFQHCLRPFDDHEVLIEYVNISLNPADILHPDFYSTLPKQKVSLLSS